MQASERSSKSSKKLLIQSGRFAESGFNFLSKSIRIGRKVTLLVASVKEHSIGMLKLERQESQHDLERLRVSIYKVTIEQVEIPDDGSPFVCRA